MNSHDALLARVTGAIIAHTNHPGQRQHPVDTAEKIIGMVMAHYGLPGHICGFLTEGGTPGLLPEITEKATGGIVQPGQTYIVGETSAATGPAPTAFGNTFQTVTIGGNAAPVMTVPTCPTCCTHDHSVDKPALPDDIGPNDQTA